MAKIALWLAFSVSCSRKIWNTLKRSIKKAKALKGWFQYLSYTKCPFDNFLIHDFFINLINECLFRYCCCFPKIRTEELEASIMSHRSKGTKKPDLSVWDEFEEGSFDISKQFAVINSLPNDHKWPWKTNDTKPILRFRQRLPTPTDTFPGSPRHRIMHAFSRNDPAGSIVSILNHLKGHHVPLHTTKRRKLAVSIEWTLTYTLTFAENYF